MPNAPELLTAAKIATELKVSDGKAKKGPCNYYAKADVAKIKTALK